MQFLKNILATIIGLFTFFILLFFLLAGISAIGSSNVVEVEPGTVLKISLDRPLQERVEQEDPFAGLDLGPLSSTTPIGLVELKNALASAKADERINGIYLDLSVVFGGLAQLKEIREALLEFKESGKFIIAYSEILSEQGYYLASVADEIYLLPTGAMEFNGFASVITFYSGLLEKLGIEPEIIRVGDFKSAAEPFLLKEMSDESRLQTQAYLDSLHKVFLGDISETRNIPVNLLEEISSEFVIRTPGDAVANKIITDTAYYDEVMNTLRGKLGLAEDGDVKFISLNKYLKAEKKAASGYSRNKISVIIGEGNIISGQSADGFIGSESFASDLRKAREDDNVKAVVLRINSPGGSALASDVMWREVVLTRQKKPVIASMSSVAASGGYYMAMGCDTIVANPNTVTGSIGVILTLFTAEELLEERLGLNFDVVSTGEFSNFANPVNKLTETEREILSKQAYQTYEDFVRKVASGRNLSVDSVKALAGGRVYAGIEAKKLGLVDVLGNLEDAIAIAASSAGVEDDYRLVYYPEKKDFLTTLLESGNARLIEKRQREELGPLYKLHQKLQQLQHMQGVQAIMPFELDIR